MAQISHKRGALVWTNVSSNFTAVRDYGYAVDLSSAPVTGTLPANPVEGDRCAFRDAFSSSETNALTIARNGNLIEGEAENVVLAKNGVSVELVYSGATRGWVLTADGDNAKYPIVVATESLQLKAALQYIIDPASAFTGTLPADPAVGDEIRFKVVSLAHSVLIARNGTKIEGVEQDIDVDIAGAGFTLTYSGEVYGWVRMNDVSILVKNEGGGYIHTQSVASATWTVVHGINSEAIVVQVFDDNKEMIQPDSVTIDNAGQVTITFTSAVSGYANVVAGTAFDFNTITFNGNGNTEGTVPDPLNQVHLHGVRLPQSATMKKGSALHIGWNTTADGSGTFYNLTDVYVFDEDVTLYAIYSIVATGGTITDSGGYRIHTFTEDGTFEVTDLGNTDGQVEYLVVAGGGGGGSGASGGARSGGGGGAGGILSGTFTVSVDEFACVVGGGGNGGTGTGAGTNGGDSSVFGFTTVGGGGGGGSSVGLTGGSGGGSGDTNSDGGAGTSGQGNAGGRGREGSGNSAGGGGGGGSAAGAAGLAGGGGDGGSGVSSSITGAATTYAGGGGGGHQNSSGSAGSGGSGGGGDAGIPGEAGAAGLGGGGGGGSGYSSSGDAVGGNGGSGIVIIRYPHPGE